LFAREDDAVGDAERTGAVGQPLVLARVLPAADEADARGDTALTQGTEGVDDAVLALGLLDPTEDRDPETRLGLREGGDGRCVVLRRQEPVRVDGRVGDGELVR